MKLLKRKKLDLKSQEKVLKSIVTKGGKHMLSLCNQQKYVDEHKHIITKLKIENKEIIDIFHFYLPNYESLKNEYRNPSGLITNQVIDMIFIVLNENNSIRLNVKFMTATWFQFLYHIDMNDKDVYECNMEKSSTEIQKECTNCSYIQIPYNSGSNHWGLFTIVPSPKIFYH